MPNDAAAIPEPNEGAVDAIVAKAGVPDKFVGSDGQVDIEAMSKSYKELEKKQSSTLPSDTPPATPADPDAPPDPNVLPSDQTPADPQDQSGDTPPDPNAPPEPFKFDMEKLAGEYAENGELSEDTYKNLSDMGFDKTTVDQFIDHRTNQIDANVQSLMDEVGGDANYSKMVDWAKTNMTPQEVEAFNNQMLQAGDDPNAARIAIMNMRDNWTQSTGMDPRRARSGGNAPAQLGYESREQLLKDMDDPRYKTDPAYQRQINNKLRHTTAF